MDINKNKTNKIRVKLLISILILTIILGYTIYAYYHYIYRGLGISYKEIETTNTISIISEEELWHAIEFLYYPKFINCNKIVEIGFNITGLRYSNPFNSSDISVYGYIHTPYGRTIKIPAFYTKNYTLRYIDDRSDPMIEFTSDFFWAIRFVPREPGIYRVHIEAVNSSNIRAFSKEIALEVAECDISKGLATIDNNTGYFVFEDGSSEIMSGVNLAWPSTKGNAMIFYKRWFEKLKNLGVKVVRVGLVPWALILEWDSLYSYNLIDAIKIDKIVELAKENDIYLIFVFMWLNELADEWNRNPYNIVRGGPIKNPWEFWSDPITTKIFKDRIRYIIARWGYSPNIIIWELINEADLTVGFSNSRDKFIDWIKDIGSYIKLLDPYDRAITVSLADYNSEPRVWELDIIDIITVHKYGPTGFKDIALITPEIIRSLWTRYKKPVIITEFGVDYRWIGMPGFTGTPYWNIDRDGIGLHDGLWSSIMSGTPVSAMSWWWDVQIEKYNLFYHFKSLNIFLKGIDPIRSNLSKANAIIESIEDGITSIVIYPSAGWLWSSPVEHNIYIIHPNGTIEGDLLLLSGFVYGRWHQQRTLNPIFNVMMLKDGKMIMRINSVGAGSAKLVVYVDDDKTKEIFLQDRDGKSNENVDEYGIFIEIELPAGVHKIKIDNEGFDWFTWDYIIFENTVYIQSKVQVIGLSNNTFALIWIRNKDYNWWSIVIENKTIQPLRNLILRIDKIYDGNYIIEFWDTYSGNIIKTDNVYVSDGIARINIDILVKDVAIKMYKR